MKVAFYARVSSERQDIDLSISAQLKALREYASRNGQVVVRKYIDEVESGRSIDRPGFRQMIITARQKPAPFEAILVWKLSRFARNREDSIIYKSLLRKQGIQVISINEPVEDTPVGRLLEGIIEVVDEFYSANLSQDVLRGQSENASRGFHNGGRPPYGYKRVQVIDGVRNRTKLEPDPKTAPIVQRIFRECLNDKGLKTIIRSLNADRIPSCTGKKWGATSVEKIIHNEAYTGTLVWGKRKKGKDSTGKMPAPQRVDGAWPAIVDKAVFKQAQAVLAARAPAVMHPREVDSPYLLSGIIRCGACGANARRKGREVCSSPLLPKNRIEAFVIDRIKEYVLADDNLQELVKLTNEELDRASDDNRKRLGILDEQITEVDSRLGRLYDALETGEFKGGELAPRIKSLLEKKEELHQVKAEVEETSHHETIITVDDRVVREYADELRELLSKSSVTEQQSLLRSFCERIEVDDSEVKLYYTLPVPPDSNTEETVGVIPIVHHG